MSSDSSLTHSAPSHNPSPGRSYIRWYVYGAIFLAVTLLPLTAPRQFSLPLFPGYAETVFKVLFATIPLFAVRAVVRLAPSKGRELRVITIVCLVAAGVCEIIHFWGTDKGHYFAGDVRWQDNTAWQLFMHKGILLLDPAYLPHSYRFLPDCVVAVVNRLTGDFVFGRVFYRFTANALLFAVLYCYARLYLTRFSSALVIVLTTAIYPVTILTYAGQFVDPASHLSFVLCLYLLASGSEAGILPVLVIGVLAKESVVVMAVCRLFYGPNRLKSAALAVLYLGIGLAVCVLARAAVNTGQFEYNRVSGVELGHAINNLKGYVQWGPLYFFTIGISMIGASLGWKYMDRPFKLTAIFVAVSLVFSSLMFSWLAEVRNLMPALFPLIISFMKYVEVEMRLDRLELGAKIQTVSSPQ